MLLPALYLLVQVIPEPLHEDSGLSKHTKLLAFIRLRICWETFENEKGDLGGCYDSQAGLNGK